MKEIEITIDKEGMIEIDLHGYQGKGCTDIAQQLSNSLGKVIKTNKKPEFYRKEKQVQKIKRGL